MGNNTTFYHCAITRFIKEKKIDKEEIVLISGDINISNKHNKYTYFKYRL